MKTEIIIRNIDVIAAEIVSITDQTRKFVLNNAIEVGRRLVEAKSQVPHGEWGNFLKEKVNYSQSTANNCMKIFDEYGSDQLSLFGSEAKSQALGNLNYTQAISLLAIPEMEREEFIEKNDVGNMSTRELDKAIKENKILAQQLKDSQAIAEKERLDREALAKTNADLEEKTKAHDDQVAKLTADLEKAVAAKDAKAAEKLKNDLQKMKDDLADSKKKVKELEEKLNKPQEAPAPIEVIPESTKKELADLQAQLEAEREKLAKSEDKLKLNNNKAMVKYSVLFESLKGDHNTLIGILGEIKTSDPDSYEKFKNATLVLVKALTDNI